MPARPAPMPRGRLLGLPDQTLRRLPVPGAAAPTPARKAGAPMTDRKHQTPAPPAVEDPAPGLRGGDAPPSALTDLVPCVVWTSRPDGWIDYANPFWVRFTGLT